MIPQPLPFLLLAARNATIELAKATTNDTTSTAACVLSQHARGLSSVLTAFIGFIVTGITAGFETARFMAVFCWFSTLRIWAVAIWALAEAVRGRPLEGGEEFRKFYGRTGETEKDNMFFKNDPEPTDPTVFGWIGWIYSAVYSPIIQIVRLGHNWHRASGGLKLVRAIGVSVTAMPLTIDTRSRYGAALGRYIGAWAGKVFNFISALSLLLLVMVATIELIVGAKETQMDWYIVLIWILGLLVFGYISLLTVKPQDGGRQTSSLWLGLLFGVLGGIFLAVPAFSWYSVASKHPGDDIATYLNCKAVALWLKLVAILP